MDRPDRRHPLKVGMQFETKKDVVNYVKLHAVSQGFTTSMHKSGDKSITIKCSVKVPVGDTGLDPRVMGTGNPQVSPHLPDTKLGICSWHVNANLQPASEHEFPKKRATSDLNTGPWRVTSLKSDHNHPHDGKMKDTCGEYENLRARAVRPFMRPSEIFPRVHATRPTDRHPSDQERRGVTNFFNLMSKGMDVVRHASVDRHMYTKLCDDLQTFIADHSAERPHPGPEVAAPIANRADHAPQRPSASIPGVGPAGLELTVGQAGL